MNAPDIDSSNVHGRGIFFDGLTTARHEVVVELAPRTLQVHGVGGRILAEWPYDELETRSSPDYVMRLARARDAVLARLEITDPQFAAAIDERSLPVDRTGGSSSDCAQKSFSGVLPQPPRSSSLQWWACR